MPNNTNRVRKKLEQKILAGGLPYLERIPASLGNESGVVSAGGNLVWVRVANGQTLKVVNLIAPLEYNRRVFIGRTKIQPSVWQVLDVQWAYDNAGDRANIMYHHEQHEYPNPDTVFVRRDQFMPLLVLPGGGFNVRLFGDIIYKPSMSAPVRVADEDIDLSSYAIASGARYVLLEITSAGEKNYVVGTTYGTLAELNTKPLPTPTLESFPICAFIFYGGQTGLRRDSVERTIIDLRVFTSDGGGISAGELPTMTAKRVLMTSDTGVIGTDDQLYYDAANDMLVLGNIAETPITGQRSFQIEGDGISPNLFMTSYGTAIAPFITGMVADGSFASKTNVKNGMVLLRLRGRGWDGSAWSSTRSEIRVVADADWGGASHPTRIEFWVTPVGSTTLTLSFTVHDDGSVSLPVKTSDPASPTDGAIWLLRETAAGHADGEAMGPLGLTYTGDTGTTLPLKLCVNDGGTTRRIPFV